MKFLVTLFIFFINLSYANLIITEQKNNNSFELNYFFDENSSLNIEEISKKEFKEHTSNNFSLGYNNSTLWFKIDITNLSNNKEFVLSLNESFYTKANLYYFENSWQKIQAGSFVKLQNREYQNISPTFPISIQKDKKKTFYLELSTKFSKFGRISISESKSFYNENKINIYSLYIFIFGILTIIIAFNIFLFIQLKEKIYIYYVLYTICYFIYLFNLSGFTTYVGASHLIYNIQAISGVTIGFLILFSIEYLEAKKYLRKMYYASLGAVAVGFSLTVLSSIAYSPWNKIINDFSALIFVSLIITSIVINFKGNKKSKYYAFILGFYFSFVVLFVLMVAGKLPYTNFTRYGYIVASAIEVIAFSLLLSNRYNEMKNKTILAQKEILKIRNKNQIELKKEVKIQTQELYETNEKLKSLLKERELLLREVYHRVKNNFQVVISMLWFEGRKTPQTKHSYDKLINRIKSMSTIHEFLYKSEELSKIKIKEYIDSIVHNIALVYAEEEIEIQKEIDDIVLEFDNAMAIGIIINELLSNSIKHNNNNSCKIEFTLKKSNTAVILKLKDNSLKFKVDKENKGLGLKLIEEFTKKLSNAKYSIDFDEGVSFYLIFESKDEA